MKRLLLFLGIFALLPFSSSATEWLTDLPTALARAQKEKKVVLLDFTGSDWCGWCMKLKAEVFDTMEFGAYAAGNLILVEVDFPRRKTLGTQQLIANEQLASKYDITGYPSIVVIDPNGRELGRCSYMAGGPTAFAGHLQKFPGMPHKGGYLVSKPTGTPAPSANGSQLIAVRPGPGAAPLPVTAPPTPYGDLTLKGITDARNGRIALINNEPLKAGESASVKSHGTNINVTVQEIRASSVVILVQGQTRELAVGESAKP